MSSGVGTPAWRLLRCVQARDREVNDEKMLVTLVHCRWCNKTHAVREGEKTCSPSAWVEESTGLLYEDIDWNRRLARVARLPLDRRAVARRRWRHRLWVATPALIFAVAVIVLMILFYSGPAPCEPYSNC